MNEETAENIMKPITMEELRINIDDLDTSKAERMDIGPIARGKCTTM